MQRLCSGEVKAVEYAEALLEQNKINACLNNFAALEPQQVSNVQCHPQAQWLHLSMYPRLLSSNNTIMLAQAVCWLLMAPAYTSVCAATQVLADARAVDELKASGHDTGPLCGLAFAVKDNIDVVGYPTVAGTPALSGALPTHVICH